MVNRKYTSRKRRKTKKGGRRKRRKTRRRRGGAALPNEPLENFENALIAKYPFLEPPEKAKEDFVENQLEVMFTKVGAWLAKYNPTYGHRINSGNLATKYIAQPNTPDKYNIPLDEKGNPIKVDEKEFFEDVIKYSKIRIVTNYVNNGKVNQGVTNSKLCSWQNTGLSERNFGYSHCKGGGKRKRRKTKRRKRKGGQPQVGIWLTVKKWSKLRNRFKYSKKKRRKRRK